RRSEARTSPSIRPKTCAGPLHSILPTIDMSEPMQEVGPGFLVAIGSGSDATCSTSVSDCCTVLPTSSSAFAAGFLSCSAALFLKLLNMCNLPFISVRCATHIHLVFRSFPTQAQRYHLSGTGPVVPDRF